MDSTIEYLLAIIGDKEVQLYTLRREVAKLREALDALTQDKNDEAPAPLD